MEAVTVPCPACGTKNRIPTSREGVSGRCGACHAALPAVFTAPVELDDATFDAFVARQPLPVLAEFWAPW